MQEIQLANSKSVLICGKAEITWCSFRRAISCLVARKRNNPPKLSRLFLDSPLGICQNRPALLDVLLRSKRAKCTDPADKIYGILGIVPCAFASKIRPDYELPVVEICKGSHIEYINHFRRLELLSFCDIRDNHATMPSWVPNWSVGTIPDWRPFSGSCASGFSSSVVDYIAPDIIEVVGVQCGTITVTNRSLLHSESDIFDLIRHIGTDRLVNEPYVPTGESLLDTYAWTLSSGRLKDRYTYSTSTLTVQGFKSILLSAKSHSALEIENPEAISESCMLPTLNERMHFWSDDGYIGLGPGSASTGILTRSPFCLSYPALWQIRVSNPREYSHADRLRKQVI
jgi:hypothetical protein